jgi:hypothetical protein
MNHPYRHIPDRQRWSRAMAGRASDVIDPVSPPPFRIDADTRVVTAGSCFAQHVARHMREHGHACMETEPAHPLLGPDLAEAFNYGIYAARYGNIYTSRQLLQLWRRATGAFLPEEDRWEDAHGWFDPFRPTIQPGGFSSEREYQEDRRQHFAAVRRAFVEMDVLVFTLGLTECWASRADGAVYPLCPGVAAGRFDADQHVLLNLTVDEVVADLRAFIEEVRQFNPQMRLILTVSPVPLAATTEQRHVLTASTYSKAVLRVAAETIGTCTTSRPTRSSPQRVGTTWPRIGARCSNMACARSWRCFSGTYSARRSHWHANLQRARTFCREPRPWWIRCAMSNVWIRCGMTALQLPWENHLDQG